MLNENTLNVNVNVGMPGTEEYAGHIRQSAIDMNVRLTEADRHAVDFLLDGDCSASQEMTSPMAGGSFMERVNAVRKVLSALDAMPADEPSASLIQATLRQILPQTPADGSATAGQI